MDPMVGDEVGSFPGGKGLRRERPPIEDHFTLARVVQVAEKGEFRHTVLGNRHF